MIELRAGPASARIDVDRGGRLASLRVADRELLVGPPDGVDRTVRWGCFLMAPWPGRLAGGRLQWRGTTYQLRQTHGRHAIHGLVWAAPWILTRSSGTTAELTIDLERDGWPFGGSVRQVYTLGPDGLSIEASIVAGDRPMPAALGWHPWFRRDAVGRGDAVGGGEPTLRLSASGVLERDRMIPSGRVLPLARRTDLRDGPPLGRRRLDDTFVGAGSPVVLAGPGLELRVTFGPELASVVVYTPWNAVCVEPQSALPNALGLPDEAARRAGRRDLQPGESFTARMGLSWHRAADPAATSGAPGR